MFKINKINLIGIIFIIISVLLFFTNILDISIRTLTQPILMGSSKGKDILFFLIFGVFLLFSNLEDYSILKRISWPEFLRHDNDKYLDLVFGLLILLGIFGLVVEVIMRYQLDIGIFTIFNAMNPNITSTSILHSHVYKSVLGVIINTFLVSIPSGIHTGSSLEQYIPFYVNIVFVLIPVLWLMMIKSIQNRAFYTNIVLGFALTIGIIGLIDGGFFSTPCLGGIYLILVIKYNSDTLTYWIGKLINDKDLFESVEYHPYVIKRVNDYKSGLKNSIPHLIILFIVILRLSIAFMGSNPEYYEVEIMNPSDDLDLSIYNTIEISEDNNKVYAKIDSSYNEMDLENNLGLNLKDKCDYYTLSWNTYSFL